MEAKDGRDRVDRLAAALRALPEARAQVAHVQAPPARAAVAKPQGPTEAHRRRQGALREAPGHRLKGK